MTARRLTSTLLGHLVFWAWNILLFGLCTMGVGPVILIELVVATWMGVVPTAILLFTTALVVLPVVFMGVGLWRFRSRGGQLLTLLYGVEIPVLTLIAVRLFAVHELTAPTALALLVVAIGMAGLLRLLFAGPRERHPLAQLTLWASLVAFFCAAAWWGLITLVYAVGLACRLVEAVPDILWAIFVEIQHPLPLFFGAFGLLTLAIFLFCPVAMTGISVRSLQIAGRETRAALGTRITVGAALITVLGIVGGLVVASKQPQAEVFAQIEAADTDAARREILADLPAVREGLLAARLGPDRLFEMDAEHVEGLWDFLPASLEQVPAGVWSVAMRPFTYQYLEPEADRWGPRDPERAEGHYATVFDTDMRIGEREALTRSARSTWSWEDAAADVLEIGQEKVHLDRQELTHQVHSGGVAEVTIHDVYRNQTFEQLEILLYFSLPESAAVTGLSLGYTEDRSEAFHHVLAPRGAAQEVYEREVRRRVDPALLEQVGPRQYRLRAFPIPAREGEPDDLWSLADEGDGFHLWLDVVVPSVQEGGAWVTPLPVLGEARNAYWDETTERSHAADSWLPAFLPGATAPGPHEVVFDGWRVRAVPAEPVSAAPETLAVLVDASFSMEAHRDAIERSLATLRQRGIRPVVYCTREAEVQRCDDFEAADALFWGDAIAARQLAGWGGLPGTGGEPRLVMLTDAGSYTLAGRQEQLLPERELPELWLVHLGGEVPAAYPDWTLDRLQRSGGGVATSVDEALARMGDTTVVDGWRWTVEPLEGAARAPSAFRALAARQAIRHVDQQAEAGTLDHLDTLHGLAVDGSVVTAYSSMIVLVDDRQREALEEASNGADRFDREAIDGQEDISAVPEPATWLLLLAGGGLLWRTRKRAA